MIRYYSFFFFFFCYQQFFILFFSHITQHNIQNITKQNNRHILNILRSNQKGGREGRTIKTQKSLLHTITYIHQKTLPSINGRRPGPTNSRCCTFTSHYLQEATDPICFSTHVWCKPVMDYTILFFMGVWKEHTLYILYTVVLCYIHSAQYANVLNACLRFRTNLLLTAYCTAYTSAEIFCIFNPGWCENVQFLEVKSYNASSRF